MGFDEILESPAFWLLGAGGVGAEILGWIVSKRAGWVAMPLWQLLVMIIGTLVAAAYFATKD